MKIGLTGKARAGKDTVAKILIEHFGYTQVSTATPLKMGAFHLLGPFKCLPIDDTKDEIIPELGVTPRSIWKDLSEEFLKPKFGRDIMARMLMKQIEYTKGPIVVSDVRFDAEAKLLTENGFHILKVERPGLTHSEEISSHVSEQGIDSKYVFGIIYNHDIPDELERIKSLISVLTYFHSQFSKKDTVSEVRQG